MTELERRVRDSLRARAVDVEPTPELWQEVDRRIARRRRVRLTAWSLAGAAAIVVGVLVVPGLLATGVTLPEIEPVTPPDGGTGESEEPNDGDGDRVVDADEDEDEGDASTGDPDTGDATEDDGPTGELPPLVLADAREIRLLDGDDERVLHTLAQEGESSVAGLAVRPGSTTTDLTAAVLTRAEGMYDLRELRVVDGQSSLEVFPPAYRPGTGSPAGEGLAVREPVWSPDGSSLAWLEAGTTGTVLRTIGWSDGPGTGDDATDNASWPLSAEVAPSATLSEWVDLGEGRTALVGAMPDDERGYVRIRLDRDADGAWVLAEPAGEVVPVEGTAVGTVAAVGGAQSDGSVRWIVRLTAEDVLLVEDPRGAATTRDLPSRLVPSDGIAELWLRDYGSGVVVGSRSTSIAYVVSGDGDATEVVGPVSAGDVVE